MRLVKESVTFNSTNYEAVTVKNREQADKIVYSEMPERESLVGKSCSSIEYAIELGCKEAPTSKPENIIHEYGGFGNANSIAFYTLCQD